MYNGSGAGWPYEQGGYFYNPLVNAIGQWKFRFTARQSGMYPGQDVYIRYYFEV